MKLIIEQTKNGFILSGKFNDDLMNQQKIVIEEEEKENSDLEAMEKLLWQIKEYFGVYYSKHNKKNLVIEIK
jgi:hypothetical protein